MIFIYLLVANMVSLTVATSPHADPQGYIVFCPCMGRFGNQVDQYLGAIAFAKGLNRTLILPPWVEYRSGEVRSLQVPFKEYFKVNAVQKYHKAIPMEEFMESLADSVWPAEERVVFCYRSRKDDGDCAAKEGNPFGPFWDNFKVDFVSSVTYGPLHYDVSNEKVAQEWNRKFPPEDYPVLAFVGSPGSFPVQEKNLHLQKLLQFSDELVNKAKDFINEVRLTHAGPFLGIHLRNGMDWSQACEHLKDAPLLFSGPQCFGYRGEKANPSLDERRQMCLPRKQKVLEQVASSVTSLKATWVFVAADHDHLLPELEYFLRKHKVKVTRYPHNDPHMDLAILGLSNHFIGNCFSSFSAFAKRHRDVLGLPSSFWAFSRSANSHEEL